MRRLRLALQSLRTSGWLPPGAASGATARGRVRRPCPARDPPPALSLLECSCHALRRKRHPGRLRLRPAERISKILFEKVPDLLRRTFSKINKLRIRSDWKHLLSILPVPSSPRGGNESQHRTRSDCHCLKPLVDGPGPRSTQG